MLISFSSKVAASRIAGNPLIGVSVQVKGTSNGVITDLNGKFSVSVSPGDVLIFSYVGMITQEISTDGVSALNVKMEEDLPG